MDVDCGTKGVPRIVGGHRAEDGEHKRGGSGHMRGGGDGQNCGAWDNDGG